MAAKPIDRKTFKGKIVEAPSFLGEDEIDDDLTLEEEDDWGRRAKESAKRGFMSVEASKALIERIKNA